MFLGLGVDVGAYLKGHGDMVSRLITPRSYIIPQLSPLLTYSLSPHDPPSNRLGTDLCRSPYITHYTVSIIFYIPPFPANQRPVVLCHTFAHLPYVLPAAEVQFLRFRIAGPQSGCGVQELFTPGTIVDYSIFTVIICCSHAPQLFTGQTGN